MLKMSHVQCLAYVLIGLSISACSKTEQPAAAFTPPPSAVGVVQVKAQALTLYNVLPGRLEASRTAEVRAQVSGIVLKRLFEEGSEVKAGQSLFKIDDEPYKARHAANLAQIERAEAAFDEAEYQAQRFEKLAQENAVSELELIRIQALHKQTKANLLVARAELRNSKVELDYSRVLAPISGRIGRSLVTEGALVSASAATPMALVQQIDPMYINLRQSSQLLLQRINADTGAEVKAVEVELLLGAGQVYAEKGRLLFNDISVDEGTGQVMLRVSMPNPKGLLLPGMFVQARLPQAVFDKAFLVPQQAVMRSEKGDKAQIIDADNTVQIREVTVAGSQNKQWIITAGLADGETLMVDGFQKTGPGAVVNPVPWKADVAVSAGEK